jgi:hypothetical protein
VVNEPGELFLRNVRPIFAISPTGIRLESLVNVDGTHL